MHALTADEKATLKNLAEAEDQKGTAGEVGSKGSVNTDVLVLDRLEDRGLVKVTSTKASSGPLNRTYQLTDKGQEALDQTS